jgi:Tol biopolymer transport system component
MKRSLQYGSKQLASQLTISPDGKTLAVAWRPKADKESDPGEDTGPENLPQPRVSLVDLAGESPAKILVAPHGFIGPLAFSPDGKRLAFGGSGAVHLFDLKK